jgi:hypothetical protein
MGDHTIELPTLHLLEEFLMSTFSVADIPNMTGKTVIVTGGSSGIGLANDPKPAHLQNVAGKPGWGAASQTANG